MSWLAIAVGGALGAMARHAVNSMMPARTDGFPSGIFLVNVLGCLVIGLLAGLLAGNRIQMGAVTRALLFTGVLGGFTTFSTYGLDTFTLMRGGQSGLAAMNALGQMVLGLAAVWAGFTMATWRP